MNAPPRCADCFFDGCQGDCACRCHRPAPTSRCHYCRHGEHRQCELAKEAGVTRYPDVLACECTQYHRPKEAAK